MTETVSPTLEELEEFRGAVRDFVDSVCPLPATRRHVDDGDGDGRANWERCVRELEVVSVGIPEELGGQGYGMQITGVLFEEFGRALVPGPLLGTVGLAASVLTAVASAAAADELAGLVDGSRTATVGWVGETGSWNPEDTPLRVTSDSGGVRVSGRLAQVIDGDIADTLYLIARLDADRGPLVLVAVDAAADGVHVRRLESLDLTRRFAEVVLDAVSGRIIDGSDAPSIMRGLQSATALLCAESAGGARRALELSVEYAKVRHQFGRPIGSFQAIKHLCADMLARVELMSALVQEAVQAAATGADTADEIVDAAKAYASDAFFDVASGMVQVHGGIGFTWEHDAHLFFRRAKSSELLLGAAAERRAALAERKGWHL